MVCSGWKKGSSEKAGVVVPGGIEREWDLEVSMERSAGVWKEVGDAEDMVTIIVSRIHW